MPTIQVLGTGCKKCVSLKENAEAALHELGMAAEVQKIEDIDQIIDFGVMSTPALAIDGDVKIVGRVATPEEIMALLSR